MLSIILCEGRTDAILLSYYLLETQNWRHYKRESPLKISVRDPGNEIASWYKRGDDFLAIWGVGGKDNFEYAIESVSTINKMGINNQLFSKIAILADRDEHEEQEKIHELNNYFSSFGSQIQLINRQWVRADFLDSYGIRQQIDLACLVVPFDGPGALENFLLHVLATHDTDNEHLISAVNSFISSTDSARFLHNNRQKLKATFATVLAIMYPEKVFTQMESLLISVPWKDYLNFQEGFDILEQV